MVDHGAEAPQAFLDSVAVDAVALDDAHLFEGRGNRHFPRRYQLLVQFLARPEAAKLDRDIPIGDQP